MRRILPQSLLVALFCVVYAAVAASPAHSFPTVFPTGTTLYDPARAFAAYTLYAPLGSDPNTKMSTVYLVDMNGNTVHSWQTPGFAISARLLPNGNLLYMGQGARMWDGRPGFGRYWIGGAAGVILELDWEGKEIFRHEDPYMHHDFIKLPNGNLVYLAWESVPLALQKKVLGGRIGTEFPNQTMFNDVVVEIDAKGKTVSKWQANAHLDPSLDIIGPPYNREEWLHCNALDLMPDGKLLITSRSTDSVMILDRKSRKIVKRWGNTAYLDPKTKRIEYRHGRHVLGGPHGGIVIPPGRPGEGELLCFDNGVYRFISRAVQFAPDDPEIKWDSTPKVIARKPFADFLGSVERLPNGNTFICDGSNGRMYQVADNGDVVWEFINPHMPVPMMQAAMFRAMAYPQDYCPNFARLDPAAGEAVTPEGTGQESATEPGNSAPAPQPAASSGESMSLIWLLVAFVAGGGVAAVFMRRAATS